jgi:hypothetical protein
MCSSPKSMFCEADVRSKPCCNKASTEYEGKCVCKRCEQSLIANGTCPCCFNVMTPDNRVRNGLCKHYICLNCAEKLIFMNKPGCPLCRGKYPLHQAMKIWFKPVSDACTCTIMYTHMDTRMHTHMDTHMHTHMDTHTCMHTNVYTHAHTHGYTHGYTHMHAH